MILMARSTGLHFSERPWPNDCLRAGVCGCGRAQLAWTTTHPIFDCLWGPLHRSGEVPRLLTSGDWVVWTGLATSLALVCRVYITGNKYPSRS